MTHPRNVIGNTLSRVSISFENLFNIRPNGVTSKNVVRGTLNILKSILRCNILAAFNVPKYRANDDKSVDTTENQADKY